MLVWDKPHKGECNCSTCHVWEVKKASEAVKQALLDLPQGSDQAIEDRATQLMDEAKTHHPEAG